MNFIIANMKWIMLVAGLLTAGMIYAAIDPQGALVHTFGESLEGPLAELIVRNWGVLVSLIGLMLIYGAFHPAARMLVLIVAGISKFAFILLVLTIGPPFLTRQAVTAVVIDTLEVIVFAAYLVGTRKAPRGTPDEKATLS